MKATPQAPRKHREEILFLVMVIALGALAAAGSWFAATALARRDSPGAIAPGRPLALAPFTLTNSAGNRVTRQDLQGNVLAVSFLFTSCSLTCPEVTRHMAEIQRLTRGEPDVRLLSITVDPRSDTPPVLARWAALHGADTNRWIFLSGPRQELHALIAASFLDVETNNPFNSMPGNFAGTDRIAVVDRQGRVRAFFDGLRPESPRAAAAEINRLLKEH